MSNIRQCLIAQVNLPLFVADAKRLNVATLLQSHNRGLIRVPYVKPFVRAARRDRRKRTYLVYAALRGDEASGHALLIGSYRRPLLMRRILYEVLDRFNHVSPYSYDKRFLCCAKFQDRLGVPETARSDARDVPRRIVHRRRHYEWQCSPARICTERLGGQ